MLGVHDVLIVGSQALNAVTDLPAPEDATMSNEMDFMSLSLTPDVDAARVNDEFGELSPFHEKNGFYVQGLTQQQVTMIPGWDSRKILVSPQGSEPLVWCLDVTDLCTGMLAAGRDKDSRYVRSVLKDKLVRRDELRERVELIEDPDERRAALELLARF